MEREECVHCWWEYELVQPLWEILWAFLRELEIELLYESVTPLLGLYLRDEIFITKQYPCHRVYFSTTYSIPNRQSTELCVMR